MSKREFISLLSILGFAAQLVNGQLEPDCNPLHADCPAKKAWPEDSYYIDFTKETGPPENWIIDNNEAVNFTPQGAEFTYGKRGDAPNMWTDFYMLGGRYDVEMQIAPGQGIISNSVLFSDIQDEIDWEFSGNQHGEQPFPPPDGKWTVGTNVFAQGQMWDGAATYQKDAYKPTTQFHTYSVDWDENHISWYVDNQVVRSVQASNIPAGSAFPQSPMKLQLGVWGGGDPANNYWTIQWAGGEVDMKGAPYTMYVRSVNITNKYPACGYKYTDRSGKITSIDKIQDGCSSSSAVAPAVGSVVRRDYPVSSLSSVASTPDSTESAVLSSSQSSVLSPPPVENTITSQLPSTSSSASLPISSKPTPSTGTSGYPVESPSSIGGYPVSSPSTTGGYPVASPSTSGGILSSLSSLIMGTSSRASNSAASSIPDISSETYPATVVSSSQSPLSRSSVTVSSSSEPASDASFSIVSSIPSSSESQTTPHITASYSTAVSGSVTSPSSIGGYPVASSSSKSGLLSSLSSLIMGTSSQTSSNSASSMSYISSITYPATVITASDSSVSSGKSTAAASTISTNFGSGYPTASRVSSGSSELPSSSMTSSSLSSLSSSPSSTSESLVSSTASSEVMPSTYTFSSEITTSFLSTVYSTNIVTITSCAPTVTNCPVGHVTTETVSLYTTVCPVTNTIIDGKTYSGQADSTTVAATSTLPSSYPVSSQIPTSLVSSDSPTTSIAPSAGSSSSIDMTSSIYQSTTVPAHRSMPTANQTYSAQLPSTPVELTTSTVYSTNIYTITSCAPTVTNCPARLGQVTTELVSLYTTICPVTAEGTTSPQESSTLPDRTSSSVPLHYPTAPLSSATPSSSLLTTSTVYTSSVYTISSCAPGASECSSNIGSVTTETIALYTTVCPVEESSTASSSLASPTASKTGTESISSVISGASSTLAEFTSSSSSLTSPSSTSEALVYTTSTVYSTNIYTVTSCAPGVTNCPAALGSVTTEIIAVSTTVCPVSDQTAPTGTTSTPQVTGGHYTTAEITISNTFSNSMVVITSTITFIDTPVPESSTAAVSTDNTVGATATPLSKGTHTTEPCTTVTLGNHFTTVITYASLTQKPPASVSSGSIDTSYYSLSSTPEVDVTSYSMSNVASTIGIGSSSQAVTTASVAATQSRGPDTSATGVTTIKNTQTFYETQTLVPPGQTGGTGQCACESTISTVYATVTMTVAETTVTRTETVEPPFPSTYSTGTGLVKGTVLPGTGASSYPTDPGVAPTSTAPARRRWFRRAPVGPRHGHGQH